MRIFFITNNYVPYSGGVVQSINAIVDELHSQGHEVFIITLDFSGKKSHDPAHVIRISSLITFIYKKNYMAIPWRPTHAIELLVQKYKPDIIHIHHPFLLGSSALDVARRYRIPCVFTYHTMYEKYIHYIPLVGHYARPFVQKTVITFCKNVAAIIAPSTSIKQHLISQGIQTFITIIPSPLRKIFCNTMPVLQKKHSPIFKLLLVTRFVPEKNIPFVFEVMNLLPEMFHLTLVGYGIDYEHLQMLAFEKFNFSSERITFVNKPSQDSLVALYGTADLFIFPSQTDTQAIVLAESMSQAVPVIALDGPGQRDIIINGKNGFIIENAQQAAEHITHIAKNKSLHEHLKQEAYKTSQRYHAKTIVTKLVNLYRNQAIK